MTAQNSRHLAGGQFHDAFLDARVAPAKAFERKTFVNRKLEYFLDSQPE
jgi:hypothetical protein